MNREQMRKEIINKETKIKSVFTSIDNQLQLVEVKRTIRSWRKNIPGDPTNSTGEVFYLVRTEAGGKKHDRIFFNRTEAENTFTALLDKSILSKGGCDA